MSDDLMQAVLPDKPPPRLRRVAWVVAALLIGGVLARAAWLFWLRDASRSLEIGPETTVITEPRTPDGFVDFSAAVNARASDGVTPENNAAVLLIRAYGPSDVSPAERTRYFELLGIPPLPETGEYLVGEREFLLRTGAAEYGLPAKLEQLDKDFHTAFSRPWNDAEFPQLAALLAANEVPLESVVEATSRARYFSPIATPDAEMLSVLLPLEQRNNRLSARLLTLRAMRRLDSRDVAGAWDDILACHRLARLNGQSPNAIAVLVGYAIDRMGTAAAQVLIRDERLTAEEARQCLTDLDQLPEVRESAAVVDFGERLALIDGICRMFRGRVSSQTSGDGTTRLSVKDRAVDWNAVLKLANQHIDELVRVMRLTDPYERETAFKTAQDRIAPSGIEWTMLVGAFLGVSDELSDEVGKTFTVLTSGSLSGHRSAQMRTEACAQLTRLGFALAVHGKEQGELPQTLAELAPGILDEVPADPCSGNGFVYRRIGDGYVLYSLGDNLKDDGGAGYADDPQGDDLVLRVGVD